MVWVWYVHRAEIKHDSTMFFIVEHREAASKVSKRKFQKTKVKTFGLNFRFSTFVSALIEILGFTIIKLNFELDFINEIEFIIKIIERVLILIKN